MLPPDVTSDLPAPRDDEPPSLRQDIADELADHLHSAFLRELHTTRDEATAAHNALDRFGDPRRIARKLWLDAMQEKIMSQRMTFVALLVVALASAGSTGLAWLFVSQAREANQAMLADARAANERLLAESRSANEVLMTRLKELSTADRGDGAEKNQSLEWNAVKVRLHSGPKPGTPLAGFEVRLTGHILDTAQGMSLERTTDANGIADFGLVRPGQHSLSISTPWKESCGWESITVYPGQPLALELGCPPAAPADVAVDLTVDWPEAMKDKGYWLACRFVRPPRVIDGKWWTTPDDERIILLDSTGAVVPFVSERPSEISARLSGGNAWIRRDSYWPFSPSHGSDSLAVWSGEGSHFPAPGLWYRVNFPRQFALQTRDKATQNRNSGGLPAVPGFIFFAYVFEDAPTIPNLVLPAAEFRLRDLLVLQAPTPIAKEDLHPPRGGFSGYDGSPPTTEDLEQGRFANLRKCVVLGGLLAGLDHARLSQQFSRDNGRGGARRAVVDFPLLDWIVGEKFDPVANNAREIIEARARVLPAFTPHADMPNHWKIPISTRLAALVAKTTEVIAKGETASSSTGEPGENAQD